MRDDAVAAASANVVSGLAELAFGLIPPTERPVVVEERDRLCRDVAGLAARVGASGAPLLVVVGGVTGAGKSTLVNTLVGRTITQTGVRRPTTNQPTLACHPDDLAWFEDDRILPSLERRYSQAPSGDGDPGSLLWLAPVDGLPTGVAMLDAPDSDSVIQANRGLAGMLLDAADVWVWVTTQGKYADEASMSPLRRASGRGASAVSVLDHLDPDALTRVADDFAARLADSGSEGARMFTIPRVDVVDQRLPDFAVFDLREWLGELADPDRREALRAQTVTGAFAALPAAVHPLLDTVAAERKTAQTLIGAANLEFDRAADRFAAELDAGKISMRDQILSSWVSYLGTGWFQRALQEMPGRIRGAVGNALRPRGGKRREDIEQELKVEAKDTVGDSLRQLTDIAVGEVARAWLADPVGRELLGADDSLHRAGAELAGDAEAAVEAWEQDLRRLLEEVGAGRKRRAQWASGLGNAVVVSLMVVTFASTGGLSGAEVAIAGAGTPIVQLLLEKVLGVQNVRWLIGEAKASLLDHVREVLAVERRRYVRAVAEQSPDYAQLEDLHRAVDELVRATS